MNADREHPDAEAASRLLEQRAIALARPPADDGGDDHLEMIVVGCGSERYGLETRWVHEVQPVEQLTAVPGAPRVWAGLINLRGNIHPVLDAARYLGLEADPSATPQVVLIGPAQDTVGLLVDDVVGLERVAADDVRPPLDAGPARPGAVRGVTSEMVPILDVETILNDPFLENENREESK